MINKTIVVLLSSFLRLTNALPTFTTDIVEGPILSPIDLLPSTTQEWAEWLYLPSLGERGGNHEEIPSYSSEMKLDGHDSTSAPSERPNPILETSSAPHSFFDITSSQRISIYNTEPVSSISDRSALAIEPTTISTHSIPKSSETRKEKTVQTKVNLRVEKILKKRRKGERRNSERYLKEDINIKIVPAPVDAKGKDSVQSRRRKISDYTHSSRNSTVFDVWEDWKIIRDISPRAHRFSSKRHLATKAIGLEVLRRMNDANRTVKEALGDLEGARLKMVVRGGHGTIASLAYAIRAKNGMKMDPRLKPVILEY
jgi:hypothetical protein